MGAATPRKSLPSSKPPLGNTSKDTAEAALAAQASPPDTLQNSTVVFGAAEKGTEGGDPSNDLWIWVAVVAVVLVLGFFSIRMLKEQKPADQ
jgi:hypothetical protein